MSVIMSCMYSSLFIAVLTCICIRGGYDAVHQYFEEGHVCCWHPAIIWVIDSISSCCEYRAFFFLLVCFEIASETSIHHILHSLDWDLIFADEFDYVGSFYTSVFEALC